MLNGNGYAVASLSLGIAAVFLSFIGLISILAIVFGGVGLRKVRDRDGRGRVQSWIGLIPGIIYTIMYLQFYGHIDLN